MKPRLLCLTAVLLLFFSFSVHAENVTEIFLRIGEPQMLVNGKAVSITPSYLNNGTTLVPLRAIAESFGATVDWEEETKTASLALYNTVLRLTIDSTTAYKGNNPVSLSVAPTLSGGTTMVPIRFIAESFGADVHFDANTSGILIHKTYVDSRSSVDYATLMKNSDRPRMGDSFVGGWAINQSDAILLKERSFDGRTHVFSLPGHDGSLTLHVEPAKDITTVNDALEDYRSIGNFATVSHFDINTTPAGIAYAHIQYKTNSAYYGLYADERTYLHNGNQITAVLSVNSDIGQAGFLALCAVIDTLDFNFDDTCEDLSDVNTATQLRRYNNTELGISMEIPAAFSEHVSAMNNIYFTEHNDSDFIQISMYSAYEGNTCESWAQSDYMNNRALYSEEYVNFSMLTKTTLQGKTAYYYTYTIAESSRVLRFYDIFIENGSYFYNIGICHTGTNTQNTIPPIQLMDSIRFMAYDAEALGTMLRTDSKEGVYYADASAFHGTLSFKKPRAYKTTEDARSMYCYDVGGNAKITLTHYAQSEYDTIEDALYVFQKTLCPSPDPKNTNAVLFLGKDAYAWNSATTEENHYAYIFPCADGYIAACFSVKPLYDGTLNEQIRTTFFDSITLIK